LSYKNLQPLFSSQAKYPGRKDLAVTAVKQQKDHVAELFRLYLGGKRTICPNYSCKMGKRSSWQKTMAVNRYRLRRCENYTCRMEKREADNRLPAVRALPANNFPVLQM
jgi:hypothetical protein